MKNPYTVLFFDFDRTLWDVEENQKAAQREIYDLYKFSEAGISFEKYYSDYVAINDRMWLEYRDGLIEAEKLRYGRFSELLETLGLEDPELHREIAEQYMRTAPVHSQLIPHARETVEHLSSRYPLYILTNGFRDIQQRKADRCGLVPFFRRIITSQEIGANKPDRRIFEYALEIAGVGPEEAVMIGDDPEADIAGAARAGIDTVFLDPPNRFPNVPSTYRITGLPELIKIL